MSLFFDDKQWASFKNDSEFGTPHVCDLVVLALLSPRSEFVLGSPVDLSGTRIPSTLHWGDSSVSLQKILELADIFCHKVSDDGF